MKTWGREREEEKVKNEWSNFQENEENKYLKSFTSGLYYKNILTIVSDNRKWRLYYKCASA